MEAGYITGGKYTQSPCVGDGVGMGDGGLEGDKVVDNNNERQRERGRGSVTFYGLAGGTQKNAGGVASHSFELSLCKNSGVIVIPLAEVLVR